ncbi:MAG: AAA family ATPase, partial [Saprospiraceae bacterium]|nr:AAA family ATPase [Saprospiraceae bacterium]
VFPNTYFWRTHSGAELDYVEERDGVLDGVEFKWKAQKSKSSKTWLDTYNNARYQLINQDNFLDFVV